MIAPAPHPPLLTSVTMTTSILALLTYSHSILAYHNIVAHFSQWCEHNHLHLNVRKTNVTVISRPSLQHPIGLNNETVDMVDSFKYLRLPLDKKHGFDQQRLSAICKLKGLFVMPCSYLFLVLYQNIVQPILLYCSTCFFNMFSVTN